jgi:two-component system, LytTR family, response regulator
MSLPPLRVFLVDDEMLALKRLTRLLNATGRVEIAGSTTDPEAAVDLLEKQQVDALFLDIQMPGLNGFELLARLRSQPAVVFTTAFDRYALQAFEVNSIDYLLKPIEAQKLDRALSRLERYRDSASRPDLMAVLERLASALNAKEAAYPARLSSRVGDRVQIIDVARITHFFARDKLTYAAANGKEHVVDHSITDLEEKLDPRRFVRIHRAILLNVDYVDEVHSWLGGGLRIRLKDGKRTELPVARDRARLLKERLEL